MKCLYYLAPTLKDTHQISDDLHDVGVNDWFLHVVSKDEAGLKKEKLHSSNYLETLDLIRDGFIGANLGFVVGVIGSGLMMYFQPFGPEMPKFVYLIILALATLFGAWEGGLFGVATENQKLKRWHEQIESGKYLVLIYAQKGQGETIKQMMSDRHAEARHVATDRHFFNPFAVVRRKRRQSSQTTATS
jgi:hypothetical protein